VLHHLESCADCRAEATRRQRTKRLLVQALDSPVDVTPLRKRISSALDAEQRRGSRRARYWGAAATLAAGVAMAVWFSRPVDAAAYRDSVTSHVQCALTVPASATYNPARIAARLKPPFTAMAGSIGRTYGQYELVDAHTCPYNGRQYAHIVYRGGGHTLSVFAEPALRGALPPAQKIAPLEGAGADLFSNLLDHYWVTATGTPRHHIFVVTDASNGETANVPPDLLRSALDFVRTLER
jgi:anti-sigma factor RsiW